MSIKHFCDVCGKSFEENQLVKISIGKFPGEKGSDWAAELCKTCRDIVIKPIKHIESTWTIAITIPNDEDKLTNPNEKEQKIVRPNKFINVPKHLRKRQYTCNKKAQIRFKKSTVEEILGIGETGHFVVKSKSSKKKSIRKNPIQKALHRKV